MVVMTGAICPVTLKHKTEINISATLVILSIANSKVGQNAQDGSGVDANRLTKSFSNICFLVHGLLVNVEF